MGNFWNRLRGAGVKSAAVSLALFLGHLTAAQGAEIKVLSAMGMKTILTSISDDFEKETGHQLRIEYGTAGLVKGRVSSGERADVVFVQRYLMDRLSDEGHLVKESDTDLARSPVGLVGRAGVPKVDISTAEALKRVLLNAESISYTDPAAGGLSGSHFARVLEQLGIAEQMKGKTVLGRPMARVSNGAVEFAVLQVSEILSLTGVQFVGPFPEELQENTPVSVAVLASGSEFDAARALIQFLISKTGANAIAKAGMVPLSGKTDAAAQR